MIDVNQNKRLPHLREKTSLLTTEPGCYIMKNESGKIIYIGKAKNLKNRVTSYFRENADHLPKVAKMVSLVYDYDFIVTTSEFEALVLECSLIKQYKPKYNILLKDDKGYSYIKVTNEPYPKLRAVLQKEDDGCEYIGPYTSSFAVKQAVEEANKVFGLYTCNKKFPQDFNKTRPCLNHHIKRCMGVCTGEYSESQYKTFVQNAVAYIKNGSVKSVERLTDEMNKAAEELDFELAAKLRDQIYAIQKAAESQRVVGLSIDDTDFIGVAVNGDECCISVMMYRDGRLFDKQSFFIGQPEEERKLRTDFLLRFYEDRSIPKKIYLDGEFADEELTTQYLSEKAGKKIQLTVPQRGEMLRLVTLAKANSSEKLSQKIGIKSKYISALEQLRDLLGLENTPEFIECYDISNLASENMVGGMVVFKNGKPLKSHYRRFTIKTVECQNDYACMQEVLRRRLSHLDDKEDESFSTRPDLIFLDGGKGHVSAVAEVLNDMSLDIPLYGLVKDSKHRTRAIATSGGEISVSRFKEAFNLITTIQDEVHRYSVDFQSKKHKKKTFASELTTVRGVGEVKAKKLITTFKTKAELKRATKEEIKKAIGVNDEAAEALLEIIAQMK
ncbi:MAG: excinuclease ABC subunit UvrC [Ruminococcus sp.]|nr:excinuclease ABC subunit UvrC [Ruminococcus sp.]